MTRMPYDINNQLQTLLMEKDMDVENFVQRMGTMSDEEIASEVGVSLQEARDMKREYSRGQYAGQIVVD